MISWRKLGGRGSEGMATVTAIVAVLPCGRNLDRRLSVGHRFDPTQGINPGDPLIGTAKGRLGGQVEIQPSDVGLRHQDRMRLARPHKRDGSRLDNQRAVRPCPTARNRQNGNQRASHSARSSQPTFTRGATHQRLMMSVAR